MSDTDTKNDPNSMEKALLALWSGARLSITTPTGNEFEATKEDGEVVVFDEAGGIVAGKEASERVKRCLRAVGTEWTMISDQ